MRSKVMRQISNCSHGCFNGAFCHHKNEFHKVLKKVSEREAEMIKFPLELNYPFPNMSWVMKRALGIRREGERLVDKYGN